MNFLERKIHMGNRNTKIVKRPDKAAEKAKKERENKIFHYTVIVVFALIVILGIVVLATLPEKAEDDSSEQVQEMTVDGDGNIILDDGHDHEHDHETEEPSVELELVEPEEGFVEEAAKATDDATVELESDANAEQEIVEDTSENELEEV
jgi:competence protein ComGC